MAKKFNLAPTTATPTPTPAASQTPEQTLADILNALDRKMAALDARQIRLMERAAAGGSLDFAEDDVTALAKRKVWARMAKWMRTNPEADAGQKLELARTEELGKVLGWARFGHHSTSTMSCLCASAEAEAHAELVEMLGGVR